MPKVFVVNEPMKYDPDQGGRVRVFNLTPAREYGELVFLLPAGQLVEDPSGIVGDVEAGLADITPDDFMLLVGDPRAIAIAAAVAARNTGGILRMLHWLRHQGRYAPVIVRLGARVAEAAA